MSIKRTQHVTSKSITQCFIGHRQMLHRPVRCYIQLVRYEFCPKWCSWTAVSGYENSELQKKKIWGYAMINHRFILNTLMLGFVYILLWLLNRLIYVYKTNIDMHDFTNFISILFGTNDTDGGCNSDLILSWFRLLTILQILTLDCP